MSSIFAQQSDPSTQIGAQPQPINYDPSQSQYTSQHMPPNNPQNGPTQPPNAGAIVPQGSTPHMTSQSVPPQATTASNTNANSTPPASTSMAPPASIQKLLDENTQFIQLIVDYQSKGRHQECVEYQQLLHRNLVWLATVADSNNQSAHSATTPSNNLALMPSSNQGTVPQTPQP